MKHLALVIFLYVGVQSLIAQQNDHSNGSDYWPAITEESKPWTRWWWMGNAVNEAGLSRLLKEYADKGFGGVEITPIYGVKDQEPQYIDFLSPDWIHMLAVTCREARNNSMGVDMNTGTGWPFGGPHITDDFAAKSLRLYSFENPGRDSILSFIRQLELLNDEPLLALSGVDESGQRINFLQEIESLEKTDAGIWLVFAATQHNSSQMVKRAAPGGEGLVFNHFSGDATLLYLDRFDSALPESNPGIRAFFNDSYELRDASSSVDLFEVFQSRKGYDLSLYLKELSGQGEEDLCGRILSDYRDVLGGMILDNFTAVWNAWAHKHGTLTRNQAHGSPANLIDLYSEVDIPEVETFNATYFPFLEDYLKSSGALLTESNRLFRKLASSAAHMKSGKLISCETFTWLNEHFKTPLYQCKPEIDNLFTEGVNHILYHGTAYSPEEEAWPGWLFYASVHMDPGNPQWEDMAAMNRYLARCQSVLQLGEHTNDLLVYWSPDEFNHQVDGLEKQLSLHNSESWIQMPEILRLYEDGYQFDFISDRILGQCEVRQGQIYTYGNVPYRAILLPYLDRIRFETFQKLLAMAEKGATVVLSNLPEYVSGFSDFRNKEQELARLAGSIEFEETQGIMQASYGKGYICMGEPQKVLISLDIARETLSDSGIKSISRRTADGYYYFIANHENERLDQSLSFKHGAANALIMNPLNGEVSLAESSFDGSSSKVHVVLEPGASMIIYFTHRELPGVRHHPYYKEESSTVLSNPWSFRTLSGGPEFLPDTMLDRPVFWSDLSGDGYQEFAGTCEYSTHFHMDSLAEGSYLIRFEQVEASARVEVNGQKVASLWCFPFEVEIGPYLNKGSNELRVEVSNLGANRIRYMDKKGLTWKKFHDINFVNLHYLPFDASGWDLLPSGLNGRVELVHLKSEIHP